MKKKFYHTEFEIQCGEFEFSDHSIIEAENLEQAEAILDDYLLNFYSEGRKYDDKVFQYYRGEIGTKYYSLKEMTKSEIKDYLFNRYFISSEKSSEVVRELVEKKQDK